MFRFFCWIIAAAFACVSLAKADTIVLPAVGDTALWQENETNNLGGELSIAVGGNSSTNLSRGLFRFNLSALPTNALITNVSLRLFVTNAPAKTNPVNSTFVLHRMLRDWGEGNKKSADVGKNGALATAGEATWSARFYPATLWSVPGAAAPVDYSPALAATNFVTGLGNYVFSGSNLVADVQAWLANPGINFGWMLRSLSENTSFSNRRFASREDGLNPPALTVMFSPVGASPPRLIISQVTASAFAFSFAASPGQSYTAEYSDGLGSAWHTLTNVVAAPGVTNLSVTNIISGQAERFYRVKTP
jgi:hypothetical protein